MERCLLSVRNNSTGLNVEVFVVDNASTDGSVEYLQPLFPEVNFIRNQINSGFAKGNNQVLHLCRGEFILFLNPDTVLSEDSLQKCVSFMEVHTDAGALGVRMVDQQGVFLKESKRGLPTPAASFWKLTGLIKFFPRSPIFSSYYAGHLAENKTHRVEVLSGAFMLVRKKVIDQVGGFDERFFMYAEDIDLSYRILKAGYHNYYFPEVTITHIKGASTKKDLKYVRLFYKAMSQYVRKHHGNGLFAWFLDGAIVVRGGVAALFQLLTRRKNSI